jgi:hypothetical protein
MLPLQVQINEIVLLILPLTYNADLLFSLDLLQRLARNHMATLPKSHEFVETVILQLGNGTGNIIFTGQRSPIDNNLHRHSDTFLMSDNLRM